MERGAALTKVRVCPSSEGRRAGVRNLWACVLCTLVVGVSSGLPLFLFFRERRLREK